MRIRVHAGRAASAAVVTVAIAGCATPPSFGYQYRMAQAFGGGEQPETITREARDLLAGAHTVAFYPPDRCLNTDVGPGTKQNERMVQANCGVMLSTLERAAEAAGYEVLSWQNLRGRERPIDYARDAHVDVLFEINEFDLDNVNDSDIQRSLTFFRRDQGIDTPVQVAQSTAVRCAGYASARDPVQAAALSGTIDIKTVSVTDGRNRWRYRKTLSQAIGRQYPQVTFPGTVKPNPGATALLAIGAVGLGLGAGFWLGDNLGSGSGSGSGSSGDTFGSAPTYLMVGGLIALAGGIALAVAAPSNTSTADEALCLDTSAVPAAPVAEPAVGPPVATGPMMSSVTLNTQTASDPLVRQREQIRNEMISDFVRVLSDAHRDAGPRASPPPPPPPPSTAPGAARRDRRDRAARVIGAAHAELLEAARP